MEETLAIKIPTQKIYKNRAIEIATFLGGPLVAGYLIAENFKAFNEPDKSKKRGFMQSSQPFLFLAACF